MAPRCYFCSVSVLVVCDRCLERADLASYEAAQAAGWTRKHPDSSTYGWRCPKCPEGSPILVKPRGKRYSRGH